MQHYSLLQLQGRTKAQRSNVLIEWVIYLGNSFACTFIPFSSSIFCTYLVRVCSTIMVSMNGRAWRVHLFILDQSSASLFLFSVQNWLSFWNILILKREMDQPGMHTWIFVTLVNQIGILAYLELLKIRNRAIQSFVSFC